MADPERQQRAREEVAQQKFCRQFRELAPDERQSVGGTLGGRKGGAARREQLVQQGETEEGKMKGYSDMGKSGAMKGGYGNELVHDPDLKEKYTGDRNYGGAQLD